MPLLSEMRIIANRRNKMTKEHTKGTRVRGRPQEHLHGEIPHAPKPIFLPDYVATQKDLLNLATKEDIYALKEDIYMLKGDMAALKTELKGDIASLEIKMMNTMATKVELRILGVLIMAGLAALGILIKLG